MIDIEVLLMLIYWTLFSLVVNTECSNDMGPNKNFQELEQFLTYLKKKRTRNEN